MKRLLADRTQQPATVRPRPLTVNQPGDGFEQEADAMADRVMAMSAPKVQRSASAANGPANAPPIVNAVVNGPGEALDAAARGFLEPRFGHSFNDVRVHSDHQAAASAQAVNALAYTVGSHVVFGAGQYAPASDPGRRLLAHELSHVIQQRSAPRDTVQRTAGSAPAPPGPQPISIDVLSASNPEDFLVQAAAQNLGVDLRVSSMDDMVSQIAGRATGNTCVQTLNVYNHGNPSHQAVVGGSKQKNAAGVLEHSPTSGFSLTWLLDNANQATLNRLRGSLCCSAALNWRGCSTAGVWAEGGTRTEAETQGGGNRFTGPFNDFYHSVDDALAHGATRFRYVGSENIQGWSNALCATITASTDFNSWTTSRGNVTRTVIHGGQDVSFRPQSDMTCACDPVTGRTTGAAPTAAQLGARDTYLRQYYLRPLEQAPSALGSTVNAPAENAAQRAAREQAEQREAAHSADLGNQIREAVLTRAGFASGAQPTTPQEALRVTSLWGLDLAAITTSLGALSVSTAERTTGVHDATDLSAQQQTLINALTPVGREHFMSALTSVRREHFWNQHLATHTVFMFPDLTGVNRYRGYTQTATQNDSSGRPQRAFVIHLSKDLLEGGDIELAAASMVHELSHTLDQGVARGAMSGFEVALADLLAGHPDFVALRAAAPDAAAARQAHVRHLRQMLYEATGYAEGEIFVHLQQLTHQPSMTINGSGVRGSDFILTELTSWIRRLKRIGMPRAVLNEVLGGVIRRALASYDDRIAAAPAGSSERTNLELNKRLAQAIVQLAIDDAARP